MSRAHATADRVARRSLGYGRRGPWRRPGVASVARERRDTRCLRINRPAAQNGDHRRRPNGGPRPRRPSSGITSVDRRLTATATASAGADLSGRGAAVRARRATRTIGELLAEWDDRRGAVERMVEQFGPAAGAAARRRGHPRARPARRVRAAPGARDSDAVLIGFDVAAPRTCGAAPARRRRRCARVEHEAGAAACGDGAPAAAVCVSRGRVRRRCVIARGGYRADRAAEHHGRCSLARLVDGAAVRDLRRTACRAGVTRMSSSPDELRRSDRASGGRARAEVRGDRDRFLRFCSSRARSSTRFSGVNNTLEPSGVDWLAGASAASAVLPRARRRTRRSSSRSRTPSRCSRPRSAARASARCCSSASRSGLGAGSVRSAATRWPIRDRRAGRRAARRPLLPLDRSRTSTTARGSPRSTIFGHRGVAASRHHRRDAAGARALRHAPPLSMPLFLGKFVHNVLIALLFYGIRVVVGGPRLGPGEHRPRARGRRRVHAARLLPRREGAATPTRGHRCGDAGTRRRRRGRA